MRLSIGTHTSLLGGWFVWSSTATTRAPKKEGKHLSPLATQRYTDSKAKGGRYYTVSTSNLTYDAFERSTVNEVLLENTTDLMRSNS